MSHADQQFDRDMGLAELLQLSPRTSIVKGLDRLLGEQWAIVDTNNQCLLGHPAALALATAGQAIRNEGETIGSLIATDATAAASAIGLLQAALLSAHRYHMAVHVHEAAIAADFAALQTKHADLERSEARYRALSSQLEQRVKEQVDTIETAQRQLFQAERMASVGQLAAGMAHEINNPIGFIRSNLVTAREYLTQLQALARAWIAEDAAAARALWDEIDADFLLEDFGNLLAESTQGADRVARIVANLKAFSSIDAPSESAVDLNDCLRATAGVAQPQAGARAAITLDLSELPPVHLDAGRLNQVLLSLVQNALAAVPDGGEVVLTSRALMDEVHLTVRDNGCGMSPQVLQRIFDPFYTTRDVGQGTGLGLTVSRDIIVGMGGRIDVQSAPGQGSVFTLVLPLPKRS